MILTTTIFLSYLKKTKQTIIQVQINMMSMSFLKYHELPLELANIGFLNTFFFLSKVSRIKKFTKSFSNTWFSILGVNKYNRK
jgi:hypothetical protein